MTTHAIRSTLLALAVVAVAGAVSFANTKLAKDSLWECNRCHQQYIGEDPPRFVKCPATENKQTHWWIRKR